uniref:BTB domain-containing protein n=1 Tax=Ananas comosus var. bracteatus TaxID=296719 RepID=A0A6V7QSG4_ANACO
MDAKGGRVQIGFQAGSNAVPTRDVQILTSGGRKISAHTAVLAAASPVMESILDRAQKRGKPRRVIRILGVPCDAVTAFVRLIHSSGCVSLDEEEEMGITGCTCWCCRTRTAWGAEARVRGAGAAADGARGGRVAAGAAVRRPALYLRCMKLLAKDFAAVKKTEACSSSRPTTPGSSSKSSSSSRRPNWHFKLRMQQQKEDSQQQQKKGKERTTLAASGEEGRGVASDGEYIGSGTKRGKSRRVIRILGVPDDAVMAFVRLIYSSGCMSLDEEEEMGRYGLHLLVLSHAYSVGWLKRACEVALALRLTAEGVVDVLLLARQCDAARLYLRCMKLLAKDFAAVKKTEAWQFLQANDPGSSSKSSSSSRRPNWYVTKIKKRVGRKRAYRRVYEELGDAMECLQHMYMAREGSKKNHPCSSSACYRNLQLLIQHLAACPRRKACPRCCRMLQLLRLHSALCDDSTQQACRIPLCSHFKLRMQQQKEGKEEADTWQLLVKKVKVARVMSSFSKRKGQEGVHEQFALCTTTARTSD